VAKVGGDVVTKAQFDELMTQLKTQAKNQSASFPAAGTASYKSYAAGVVDYLVQAELIDQGAARMKVSVSDSEVASQVKRIEKAYGGENKVLALLKPQGMTMALLKMSLRVQLLSGKVSSAAVKDVKVSGQKMRAYWRAHSADYQKKATRTVRHVLVASKARAQKVRRLLAAGATWKKVAKQYSTDSGSKNSGGNLGALTRGTAVSAVDKAAFSLRKSVLSQPIKTQFGWHIIQVTAASAARKVTFAQAASKLKQTLLSQARQAAWKAWLAKAAASTEITYAAGYDPSVLKAAASASASPSPSATAQ
jgi:foldase protein PrsA